MTTDIAPRTDPAYQRHLRLRAETCFPRECEPTCPHMPDLDLPRRVVAGANGAYWRDYGEFYSMCPVSTDNDPVAPVTVYVRADLIDPAAGERLVWDDTAAVGERLVVAQPQQFGPCPKCGHADVGVGYRDAVDAVTYDCQFVRPSHPQSEHFDVTCRTCHHKWADCLTGGKRA